MSKDLKYLLTILHLQYTLCTIDVSLPEYQYLSNHLTPEECRRLYATLHFEYHVPNLTKVVENIPRHEPCLKLLLRWDKGKHKWEGQGKTHVDIARRLRLLGRNDLAIWLSNTVLNNLADDVDNALNTKFSNTSKASVKKRAHEDIKTTGRNYDALLGVVAIGLILFLILNCYRMIKRCCRKKEKERKEEILQLLGGSDSEQETVYECVLNHTRSSDNDEFNIE